MLLCSAKLPQSGGPGGVATTLAVSEGGRFVAVGLANGAALHVTLNNRWTRPALKVLRHADHTPVSGVGFARDSAEAQAAEENVLYVATTGSVTSFHAEGGCVLHVAVPCGCS